MEAMYKGRAPGSRLARLGELGAIVAHVALSIWGALALLDGWRSQGATSLGSIATDWAALALSVPAAWLVSDLCSGIVHYLADNFGSPDTPLLGRAFIAPFREHHLHPEAMLDHDFLEKNASSALCALPLLIWIPIWPPTDRLTSFLAGFCLQLGLWLILTNEIHAACHRSTSPRFIRWLQASGIILPPAQHRLHHEAATQTTDVQGQPADERLHYCITSGAADRLLRWFAPTIVRTTSRVP